MVGVIRSVYGRGCQDQSVTGVTKVTLVGITKVRHVGVTKVSLVGFTRSVW